MSFSEEVWSKLKAPFEPDAYEWLIKKKTKNGALLVPYIRKPAVIERLVQVFGVGKFSLEVDNVNIDRISVKEDDGVKEVFVAVAKATLTIDTGEDRVKFSDIGSSRVEARDPESNVKGAATDAIKRVAKLVGIGLHLDVGGDLSFFSPVDGYRILKHPVILFDPSGKPHAVDPAMPSPGKGEPVDQFDVDKLESAKKWLEEGNRWSTSDELTKFYLAVLYNLDRRKK